MNNKVRIDIAHKIPVTMFGILGETFAIQKNDNEIYNFAAVDLNGDLQLHKTKPKCNTEVGFWDSQDSRFITKVEINGDWKDSLEEFHD